jgi:hypothetical protein
LDEELASEAEAWSLQMAITGNFSHAAQSRHGENLAYFEPAGTHNYVEATRLWIDERKNYHGQILTQGSGEKKKKKDKQWVITPLSFGLKLGGWGWRIFDVLDDGEWATPGRTYIGLGIMLCRRWGRRLGGRVRGIRMSVHLRGGRRSFGFSGLGGEITCESLVSFAIPMFGFFSEMLRCLIGRVLKNRNKN